LPTWEPPPAKPLSGPQHGPVRPPSAGLATVRHRGRADLFHAAAADEGTSIAAASAKCGLPAGSIYWHFKDKEDLLAAVIERSFETWLQRSIWRARTPGPRWNGPH
jgi:AcrR family transcriptional regulator